MRYIFEYIISKYTCVYFIIKDMSTVEWDRHNTRIEKNLNHDSLTSL